MRSVTCMFSRRVAPRGLRMEARRLDDERLAVPAADRRAVPLRQQLVGQLAAVRRDHARVAHLALDDHVARALEDLQVAVVAARQDRRDRARPEDAALGQRAHLGAVELFASARRGERVAARGGRGRQRRDAAVLRLRDDRRAQVQRRDAFVLAERELAHAVVHVGLRAGLRLVVARTLASSRVFANSSCSSAREELLVAVLRVALERRRRELGVGARDVGIAPRRARLFCACAPRGDGGCEPARTPAEIACMFHWLDAPAGGRVPGLRKCP